MQSFKSFAHELMARCDLEWYKLEDYDKESLVALFANEVPHHNKWEGIHSAENSEELLERVISCLAGESSKSTLLDLLLNNFYNYFEDNAHDAFDELVSKWVTSHIFDRGV
jgi:hypothetical protein